MMYTVWDNVKKELNKDIFVNQDGSLFHYIKAYDGRSCVLPADSERYHVTWYAGNDEEINSEEGMYYGK